MSVGSVSFMELEGGWRPGVGLSDLPYMYCYTTLVMCAWLAVRDVRRGFARYYSMLAM